MKFKMFFLLLFLLFVPFNTCASGPLLYYGFDPFEFQENTNSNVLRSKSWQKYLDLVKEHVETGVQILKDDAGAFLGGAELLREDTKKNMTLRDYYENLLKPINQVTDNLLEKRFEENISKGLNVANSISSMAQYYHKAIPTEIEEITQERVLDIRQNADKALKGFFAGKEGISNRAATPEEFEKIVKMLYEQAHRSLDAKESLQQALQGFANDKATSKKEKSHINAIKTIFTMAYLYHQGDEGWNDAGNLKNKIGDGLHDISECFLKDVRVRDIFENYKQFHDCYCDDVKENEKFNKDELLKNPIKWQEITNLEAEELAWAILKFNRDNVRNHSLYNYNDSELDNLYGMLDNNNDRIESIIKPSLSFLSQIYRGQNIHADAVKEILEAFHKNIEIVSIFPKIFAIVSKSSFTTEEYKAQRSFSFRGMLRNNSLFNQKAIISILNNYSNTIPKLEEMKKPMEQFLINYLWAFKREIAGLSNFGSTELFEKSSSYLCKIEYLRLLDKENVENIFNVIFNDSDVFFGIKLEKCNKCIALKYFLINFFSKRIKFSEQETIGKTIPELYLTQNHIDKIFKKILQKDFSQNKSGGFLKTILEKLMENIPKNLLPSIENINLWFDKVTEDKDFKIFFINPFLLESLEKEKVKNFIKKKDILIWYNIFSNTDLEYYLEKSFLEEKIKKISADFANENTDKNAQILKAFFQSSVATNFFDDSKWIGDQFELFYKISKGLTSEDLAISSDVSYLMISILKNSDWEKYVDVNRLNNVVAELWTMIRENHTNSSVFSNFLKEILETSVAGKIDEVRLLEIYRDAQAHINSQSRVAIAIQNYVAGPCLAQRGTLIALPFREEFANAGRNNGGIAMEIHSYIPPEALKVIENKINTYASLKQPILNINDLKKKLTEKIKAVFNQQDDKTYANVAISALEKLVAAGDNDQDFYKLLSNLTDWLDNDKFEWSDSFKDKTVRWKSYLTNSFVESGTAYEGSNPVSCVKGIKERAIIGVKGLEPETTNIISAFEVKKDFLDQKLLQWMNYPITLVPDLVYELEKDYKPETITSHAIENAQKVWRKKAQEEFEKITTNIKSFVPDYKISSDDIGKIVQISQTVRQWVRQKWGIFSSDSKKTILANLKKIITNTEEDLIKTIEKSYRVNEEDKKEIIEEIHKIRSSINKKNEPVNYNTTQIKQIFEKLKNEFLQNNQITIDENNLKTLIYYLHYVGGKSLDDIHYAEILDLLENEIEGVKIDTPYKPIERQKIISNIKNEIKDSQN